MANIIIGFFIGWCSSNLLFFIFLDKANYENEKLKKKMERDEHDLIIIQALPSLYNLQDYEEQAIINITAKKTKEE